MDSDNISDSSSEKPEILLAQLGFSSKEVSVYLAALELGSAPVSVLAKKARLKRPTAFEILKRLSHKGIAEFFLKKQTRYYSVIGPAKLLERYKAYVGQLEAAVPMMLAMGNAVASKPRITFYEGKEDLKRLYLDVLTSRTEILNYFLPEKVFEYFTFDWVKKNFLDVKLRLGIPVRGISPDSSSVRDFLSKTPKAIRENRIITDPKLFFTNEIYLYDDRKMVLFSFDEDFAFLIESADVVQTQKAIFELAWNSAKLAQGPVGEAL